MHEADPAWFNDFYTPETSTEHTFLEIKSTASGISSSKETKTSEQVPTTCADSADPHALWTLRLLMTSQAKNERLTFVQYPVHVRNALQEHWNMPDMCFRTQKSCSMAFSPLPCNEAWLGLILRFVYSSPFVGTLVISHNRRENITYAVCYGMEASKSKSLLDQIVTHKNVASQPYLLALLLNDCALADVEHFTAKIYNELTSIRGAMGCDKHFSRFHQMFKSSQVYRTPDVAEMPRKLTALTSALASNAASIAFQHEAIDFLDQQLVSESRRTDNPSGGSAGSEQIVRMREHLEMMRQMLKSTKRRNDYARKSVQAQVLMVYALLAQKDTEMSLQYGADMRVIAIVTLFFLPGTFVATLFSTTFWDFGPTDGSAVSGWIWLYWVIAIALTVGVLCAWRRYPRTLANRKAMPEEEDSGKLV